MCYSQPQTSLCSCAGSHGGAATPPYHNLVGLTCWSAQIVANQRSAVRNSGPLETCSNALPPHPGPLPRGEGDYPRQPSFQAGPIDVRASTQAVPSPWGEGQGEGDLSQLPRRAPSTTPSVGRARRSVRAAFGPTAFLLVRTLVATHRFTMPKQTARSDGPHLRRSAEHRSASSVVRDPTGRAMLGAPRVH